MTLEKIKFLFLASRPKTLVAGLCPILAGAAYAFYFKTSLDVFYFTVLILASVCIQVATNFFNDALDADAGRDGNERLGPVRQASSGVLSAVFLKRAALGCLLVAFFMGGILAYKAGLWIFIIGLPALFLAYLYTGSKFALSTTGTADAFVIMYFGVIPVWATTYILSEISSFSAAVTGLQLGLFANALLLINNLRDESEDRFNNKKTLVVRLGRKVGLWFLALCLLSPYALGFFLDSIFFRVQIWTAPLILLSVFVFVKVCRSQPSKKYNAYLGLTALKLLLFTYFLSLAVVSS